MNNLKQLTLIALLLLSVCSCSKENPEHFPEGALTCGKKTFKTNVRIENISDYDFEKVSLKPELNEGYAEEIKSGEKSCYWAFDYAYRYAYVKLEINGEEFVLQPIDYVGETKLGDGSFTYLIDVTDIDNRYLSIELK